jgi:hypothetical protein
MTDYRNYRRKRINTTNFTLRSSMTFAKRCLCTGSFRVTTPSLLSSQDCSNFNLHITERWQQHSQFSRSVHLSIISVFSVLAELCSRQIRVLTYMKYDEAGNSFHRHGFCKDNWRTLCRSQVKSLCRQQRRILKTTINRICRNVNTFKWPARYQYLASRHCGSAPLCERHTEIVRSVRSGQDRAWQQVSKQT